MDYEKAIPAIAAHVTFPIENGLVLGSGLASLGETFENRVEIPYKDIPGFPLSTVSGHKNRLIVGTLQGKKVVIMQGRYHYYEGHPMKSVAFGIRLMKKMGVRKLILTNAAGSVNTSFAPGQLMLIKDHLSFFCPSPLIGENDDSFGTRFPDMTYAYDPTLIEKAKQCASEEGIALKEGIYAFMKGPMFETPAEIRALRMLGADAVGMSTVPETIVAVHASMQVLGISCLSNMAAGITKNRLTHEEVMETGESVRADFQKLLVAIVRNL